MPKKHDDLIKPIDLAAFGHHVYQARNDAHIQMNALAATLGISEIFLRQIEMGKRLPSLTVFMNLCNALHVSPSYLLMEDLKPGLDDPMQMTVDLLSVCTPRQGKIIIEILDGARKHMKD